jgi:hypothetical protein
MKAILLWINVQTYNVLGGPEEDIEEKCNIILPPSQK